MIKLKQILMELSRDDSYSWQDPSGKFHSISGHDTHASWAARELDQSLHGNITQQRDSVMTMWKKGWMRIARDGDTIYAHNEVMMPNRKQQKQLEDLAIEQGFSKVVADGGEEYKVIWSEHDQLVESTKSPDELKSTIESWRRVKEGDDVSGLIVRKEIPNTSSIRSSLDNYEVMGVREVPIDIFSLRPGEVNLANQIKESGEINPLIVVVDGHPDGMAYILEGSHRIDALKYLNVKTFPALVVLDMG
jgi:hypothetical protein